MRGQTEVIMPDRDVLNEKQAQLCERSETDYSDRVLHQLHAQAEPGDLEYPRADGHLD
jgi:hypothetical protein